jgi:hypothetical protein
MAEAIGCPQAQASLVTYILTGIPPTLPRSTIAPLTRLHEFTGIFSRQVTVDYFTGDVPFEEHRQIYRQYRNVFSTMGKKRLSAENEEFLALVKRYGPVPQGRGSGAMAFWESVRQAWNKKNAREAWKEPAVARKHYGRLITRARKKGVER